ncbi:cAMP-binding domain of CRP or a regulatory subunit of cAMP-dependent protein kinases [Lishizhenia tianjinensis]|uniref:cAMP-binding domain of CRP or a regulatory subunit of cAMP-dependent protein kinases n=1 Tax=Lishizhenia tianjinensis TaxID=477690 RepID=A0A1I6XMS9_9FLAO|nr:Crp/Fnr family transcriptional regulator [Lishizhenia tianjinensis]SFT39610.1 cAMP-binding domain of CRP or a regulatory subunit of cAMP-dependent protein kinases [Lishizhenia tianjinensis]
MIELKQQFPQLSESCLVDLKEAVNYIQTKTNELLVREGEYANKAFFILEGSARAYYLKEGKDITDWFALENDFISAIVSFFSAEPSPHFIETLEPSKLLVISKDAIEELAIKHADFEVLYRQIITNTMLQQQRRLNAILFQRAENRYHQMLDNYPGITQRVPLTHIASYLGITLETLSRIRGKLLKS